MTKADIEHYYSSLVLKTVKGLVPSNKKWESLSHRSKQNYLNKAVDVLYVLINDNSALNTFAWIKNQSIVP
jgi:hypothetical protein